MPTALENVFYNNTTVKIGTGCTIEYNMNSLIDGIEVSTPIVDATYINGIDVADGTILKVNPFKKLFPVDSVIKPFRPSYPGVKYFIMLPNDTTTNSFSAFRTVSYPGEGANANSNGAEPRVYYPGISNAYKYWVTPKDTAANITVTYKPTGSVVEGNKYALTNKIVLKFEKGHSIPSQYKLIITPKTGSAIDTGYINTPSNGQIIHYYNGTNWSTTATPSSYSSPQEIKSIQLITSAPASGRVIGVIELSARWIKDISSQIVKFDISKESSANTQDILPVGFITANSLSLDISNYDELSPKVVEYNRSISSFDNSVVYMCKNPELKPYVKVYHSGATTVPGDYDVVSQGIYYIDTWNIDSYSDTNISAMDGGKYLMESIAPDIVCEQYPVTAIIRRLLDSVGFTSYNFNTVNTETSIPTLAYWWTDDTKTVWEHLQELCRDIQMNAVFDDDGILQLYSRDYLYSKTTTDWEFYYDESGSKLPNIIEFNKKEIASANQVKVLWQTYLSSNYVGDSGALWTSPTSFLSAGTLQTTITKENTVAEINDTTNSNYKGFSINTKITDEYSQFQSVFNFSGYFLVNSEIFEYDAIQYQYIPKGQSYSNLQLVWVSSEADISKYRYLSEPDSDPLYPNFKPTGRIRIKSRAALGTQTERHESVQDNQLTDWTGRTVTWQI